MTKQRAYAKAQELGATIEDDGCVLHVSIHNIYRKAEK